MIENFGRDMCMQFWKFTSEQKNVLSKKLANELPALRGKIGASQEELASAIGVSRQTYSAYETQTRPMPWNIFLALLFFFDYNIGTHYMIRKLELFPNEFDECWLAGKMMIEENA